MSKTLLLVAALCAVVVAAVGASSAFAGEVTGNGKPLSIDTTTHELNGRLAVCYSGLNLIPEDPTHCQDADVLNVLPRVGSTAERAEGRCADPALPADDQTTTSSLGRTAGWPRHLAWATRGSDERMTIVAH